MKRKKAKVLLIKPYGVADEIIPPFSLGYLAAVSRDKAECHIIDCIKDGYNLERLRSLFLTSKYDVVGIGAYSNNISTSREIFRLVKQLDNNVCTILGGPHVTVLPEETFEYFGQSLDYGFCGESEIGFPEFISIVSDGGGYIPESELADISGLIYRNNGRIQVNPCKIVSNLDEIPFVAWDILRPETYPMSPHGAVFKRFPLAPMIATRGCPFQCAYCSASILSGKKIRRRSVDNIIEEIQILHRDYGIQEIHFEDDNFTASRGFVIDFCERLMSSGLKISWAFPNGIRVDTLDGDLLKIMKRAGCYSFCFGIESGSQRILDRMKKKITLKKIKEKAVLARELGFSLGGFFILGFPSETEEEIEETIRFAKELPLDRAAFFYFQYLPGTEEYNRLIQERNVRLDWNLISLHNSRNLSDIPEKTLIRLRRKALLTFYLRPGAIWAMVRGVQSWRHLKYILKRSVRWLRV